MDRAYDDIEQLYRRFGPMVFRRCLALLGDEEDAIDETHELFARLIQNNALTIDTPSSYLYVAATRRCLNHIRQTRQRKTDTNSTVLDSIASYGSSESKSVAGQLLERIFEQNPDTTRVIAVLHHVDGLTLEETASEVGMSVSGVRRRLRKLRGSLVDLMEES